MPVDHRTKQPYGLLHGGASCALAETAGRDPASIRRAASLSIEADLDGVARTVDEWKAAGFDYLVCGWPAEGRELVERFAQRIL